jgi:hypothetical protein
MSIPLPQTEFTTFNLYFLPIILDFYHQPPLFKDDFLGLVLGVWGFKAYLTLW